MRAERPAAQPRDSEKNIDHMDFLKLEETGRNGKKREETGRIEMKEKKTVMIDVRGAWLISHL